MTQPPFPPRLQAPGTADAAVRADARGRRAAAGRHAPGHLGRPGPPARAHGQGRLRDRRPLPAHERAAVDRRARRLHRRLSAARGPVRPGQRRPGPDADDRRPRPGRRLPPDLVAGRPRPEGRPARQEGRGAPADPGPPVPLLPGPHRRRSDRGRDPARTRPVRRQLSRSSGLAGAWTSARSIALRLRRPSARLRSGAGRRTRR